MGKVAIAGITSALNGWNDDKSFKEIVFSSIKSIGYSVIGQIVGFSAGKIFSDRKLIKIQTTENVVSYFSYLLKDPAIKTGVIKFFVGIVPVINDFLRKIIND